MNYTKHYVREVEVDDTLIKVNVRTEHNRVQKNNSRARAKGLVCNLKNAEWILLLASYYFCCAYCGRPFETMDHIIPLSNGGGSTITNVIPSCRDCNEAKGTAVWLPAWCGE